MLEAQFRGDLADVPVLVGRDERVDFAGLEACERLFALALRLVAVHRDGLHTTGT